MPANPNFLDRLFLFASPRHGLERMQYKQAAELFANSGKRNYEAAKRGRRTQGWVRTTGDSNAVNRAALSVLREHTRDLVRNNPWAKRGLNLIGNGIVGYGIVPKSSDKGVRANARAIEAWHDWASTTECDADGRLNFYGLQRLVARTVAESGECLIRKIPRRLSDGLAIPLQIHVLEPDYIDTAKDGLTLPDGGRIIMGVEFNKQGRRVAYWLWPHHPGDFWRGSNFSSRVDASEILHVFETLRAGQVRGVPWFASVIVKLKDHDEYDDATLMKQKIAALFTAFDIETDSTSVLGEQTDPAKPEVETMEPGSIIKLSPGHDIKFAEPPTVGDYPVFTASQLRAVAVGLGLSYEALSGDFSAVNFSSARMSRLIFADNVDAWRWDMLIPQFCDGAWRWAQEAAFIAGIVPRITQAIWTPPPMRMIEPDKEGLASQRMVRGGLRTPSEMIREQGYDPDEFYAEYAADLAKIDSLGIVLDSDARRTTQAGNPVTPGKPSTAPAGASGDGKAKQLKADPATPEGGDSDSTEPGDGSSKVFN